MKYQYALLLIISIVLFGCQDAPKKESEQQPAPPKNGSFLFVSDVHLNPQGKTTNYGDDAGMDIWKQLISKLDAIMGAADAPDFVIYTGDLPVHATWCQPLGHDTLSIHDTAIADVLGELRDLSIKYKKPVFYMPGNNDALNGDYLPFTNAAGKSALDLSQDSPLFFPDCGAGSPSLISFDAANGYYSAKIMPGLRMIALNTVLFNSGCPDTGHPKACAAEMQWLKVQLAEAKAAGDKVYMAMHIPPGNSWNGQPNWNTSGGNWLDTFIQITADNSTTISGIFYGHTHMDELRRIWGPKGDTVTKVAICCPGISAQHKNNPGFKVVYYDGVTKEPTDFKTMFTALPIGTAWPDSTYTFRGAFASPTGTIYENLKMRSSDTIAAQLAPIYSVKNPGSPNTPASMKLFIDVKP